jgi:hypothetical protein
MWLSTERKKIYALTSPGLHVAQLRLSDNEHENVHRLKKAFASREPEVVVRKVYNITPVDAIEKRLHDFRKLRARAYCGTV